MNKFAVNVVVNICLFIIVCCSIWVGTIMLSHMSNHPFGTNLTAEDSNKLVPAVMIGFFTMITMMAIIKLFGKPPVRRTERERKVFAARFNLGFGIAYMLLGIFMLLMSWNISLNLVPGDYESQIIPLCLSSLALIIFAAGSVMVCTSAVTKTFFRKLIAPA